MIKVKNNTTRIIKVWEIELTIPWTFNVEQAQELDKLLVVMWSSEQKEDKMQAYIDIKWSIIGFLSLIVSDWNIYTEDESKIEITKENIARYVWTSETWTTMEDLVNGFWEIMWTQKKTKKSRK